MESLFQDADTQEEMHISYAFMSQQCDDSIFPYNIFTEVLTQNILQINYL